MDYTRYYIKRGHVPYLPSVHIDPSCFQTHVPLESVYLQSASCGFLSQFSISQVLKRLNYHLEKQHCSLESVF